MFTKLLVIGLALVMSSFSFAKEEKINKTIICDEASTMLPWFGEKYGEEPMWIGVVSEATADKEAVYASVVLNIETQTWTMVMYNRQVSCILESGTGFKFKFPKTGSL